MKEPFYKMLDAGLDNTSYTIETGAIITQITNHKSQHTVLSKQNNTKKKKERPQHGVNIDNAERCDTR